MPRFSRVDRFDWDDVRIFLAIARTGALASGARALGCNGSTVGRRLDQLETKLNTKLLERTTAGVALTRSGRLLASHATLAEEEILGAVDSFAQDAQHPSGIVRVATPEGLGALLIARHIPLLQSIYPDLRIELIPATSVVNLAKREADILVTIERPEQGRIKFRKLGDYRLSLYASRDYVARYGSPTASDLREHKFVWYIDDLLRTEAFRYLPEIIDDAKIVFRSSSIAALQEAVASGIGIGLIHRFIAQADSRLVSVLPDVSIDRSYWVMYRSDQRGLSKIRAVLSFLDEVMSLNRLLLLGAEKRDDPFPG